MIQPCGKNNTFDVTRQANFCFFFSMTLTFVVSKREGTTAARRGNAVLMRRKRHESESSRLSLRPAILS